MHRFLSLAAIVPLFVVSMGWRSPSNVWADDWPQWRGPNRDGVWSEMGIIEKFRGEQIPAKWRVPVGPGYSGPTVAGGRVFLTDRQTKPEQIERILCFDEQTGKELWKVQYPSRYRIGYRAGPRACVTVDGDRAYALGAMGHLHCLDAATGEVHWKRDLNAEYRIYDTQRMPIWGIAAAPLIFEDLVLVEPGAEEACVVALDKTTGKEKWRALGDRGQYSAPILVQQAGMPVVVFWTGDGVVGLNPRTGKTYWREQLTPVRMPIGIATPIVSKNRLFLTSFYDGALMLKLRQDRVRVSQMWRLRGRNERNTKALHSIMSTPLFLGDYLYGVGSYGELRCLKSDTGERVWEDKTATPRNRWSNIHMVKNGNRVWMFNEIGELIIAQLSPQGFKQISRAQLIEPTEVQLPERDVCWAHPAYANKHVFIRNDKELLCASLAK